jgi:2-oxoacid dehydrogenase-like protein with E3 subunit-binding domain
MSAMAAVRRPASPYARRVAREAAVGLELISGSGPGGRIVAADVEAFLTRRRGTARPAQSGTAVSAFAATLTLAGAWQLIDDLSRAEIAVSFEALLVRASALALEAQRAAGPDAGSTVAVGCERPGGLVMFPDAHLRTMRDVAQRLLDHHARPDDAAPVLTVRRIAQPGLRPTAMPLVAGAAMRLVVTAADAAPTGKALLCLDQARIDEDAAAAILARIRDSLDQPLRLLV